MLIAEFQQYLFGFTIFITSVFLVMLVLVQRGRGGGLTGALGGAGGQSAFGTKAGDLFTRITVGVAALWIFLCAAAVFFLKDRELPQTGVLDRDLPSVMGNKDPGAAPVSDPAAGAASGIPGAPTTTTTAPAASPTTATKETPAAQTPAAQTPAAQTPAAQTPAAQTPQAEITTVPSDLNLDSGTAPAATGEAPKSN